MAFPVILVNSATGSDSNTSGAGPSTAVTGTAASTNVAGTTVTVDAGTDLSGVATDGSAAFYLNDTTAGHRRWSKITATSGSGGSTPTVTVSPAFTGSLSGKSWAIGGKRASVLGATSLLLFDNNSAAGDAQGGWVVEMQSGHSETNSAGASVSMRCNGDTTNGPVTLRGASGAAVTPAITLSGTGTQLVPRGQYFVFRSFKLLGASGASTACLFAPVGISTNVNTVLNGLTISGFSGGSCIDFGTNNAGQGSVVNCELSGNSLGVLATQNTHIAGCYIHGQSSHGVSTPSGGTLSGLAVVRTVISGCGGDGVHLSQGRSDLFAGCVVWGTSITGCTANGISYTGDSDSLGAALFGNNILTSNGAYGVKFTDVSTAPDLLARGFRLYNHAFYNNTSGKYLPASLDTVGVSLGEVVLTGDPFTNASGGDFSLNNTSGAGASCRAAGFPTTLGTSTNYLDIGALQHQDSGGGGGGGAYAFCG